MILRHLNARSFDQLVNGVIGLAHVVQLRHRLDDGGLRLISRRTLLHALQHLKLLERAHCRLVRRHYRLLRAVNHGVQIHTLLFVISAHCDESSFAMFLFGTQLFLDGARPLFLLLHRIARAGLLVDDLDGSALLVSPSRYAFLTRMIRVLLALLGLSPSAFVLLDSVDADVHFVSLQETINEWTPVALYGLLLSNQGRLEHAISAAHIVRYVALGSALEALRRLGPYVLRGILDLITYRLLHADLCLISLKLSVLRQLDLLQVLRRLLHTLSCLFLQRFLGQRFDQSGL